MTEAKGCCGAKKRSGAEEYRRPPESKETDCSTESQKGASPAKALTIAQWNWFQNLREWICVVLKHKMCSNLLHWSYKTNICNLFCIKIYFFFLVFLKNTLFSLIHLFLFLSLLSFTSYFLWFSLSLFHPSLIQLLYHLLFFVLINKVILKYESPFKKRFCPIP